MLLRINPYVFIMKYISKKDIKKRGNKIREIAELIDFKF